MLRGSRLWLVAGGGVVPPLWWWWGGVVARLGCIIGR